MDNLIPENLDKFDKQLHDMVDVAKVSLVEYGFDVVSAIFVLIIGWWLANLSRKLVAKALSKIKNADATLVNFISSAVRYAILIVTLIAVLARFGVQTTSLIAVLGAAGLAIGLALQGTLSNVAAGVMLLLFRPYRLGHYVEIDGQAGTVKNLGLFTTELTMLDNVQIIIPNSNIWGSPIRNFSHNPTRRMDVDVGISYEDNIDKAFGAIRKVIDKDARILEEPAPSYFVKSLGDNSVNITVRFWTKTADHLPVKLELNKEIKESLDAAGIEIPFPQRVMHVVNSSESKPKANNKKTKKA